MKDTEDSIDIIEAHLRRIRAISDLLLSIGECNLEQDTLPEIGMLLIQEVSAIKEQVTLIHSYLKKERVDD